MKVHIVSYYLYQFFFSKSKIHILTISEPMSINSPFSLLIEFCQIKKKVENGSCSRPSCVNQHDFNGMYVYHMKVHMFGYNLGPKKIWKSKIHISTISGPMSIKPAIVRYWGENISKEIQIQMVLLSIPLNKLPWSRR